MSKPAEPRKSSLPAGPPSRMSSAPPPLRSSSPGLPELSSPRRMSSPPAPLIVSSSSSPSSSLSSALPTIVSGPGPPSTFSTSERMLSPSPSDPSLATSSSVSDSGLASGRSRVKDPRRHQARPGRCRGPEFRRPPRDRSGRSARNSITTAPQAAGEMGVELGAIGSGGRERAPCRRATRKKSRRADAHLIELALTGGEGRTPASTLTVAAAALGEAEHDADDDRGRHHGLARVWPWSLPGVALYRSSTTLTHRVAGLATHAAPL